MCRARCHDCKAAISRNAENSERGLEADLRRRDKPAFRGSGCQSHPALCCRSSVDLMLRRSFARPALCLWLSQGC